MSPLNNWTSLHLIVESLGSYGLRKRLQLLCRSCLRRHVENCRYEVFKKMRDAYVPWPAKSCVTQRWTKGTAQIPRK